MSAPIATPGQDGDKIESLLRNVKRQGSETLYGIAQRMAEKAVNNQSAGMSQKDLSKLTQELTNANATANMLGRAKIRNRMNKIQTFSEGSDFSWFAESAIHPMTPIEALKFFMGKVPIAAPNPGAFEAAQMGNAFNLAVTTDQTLLRKIYDTIAKVLTTGEKVRDSPKEIEGLLTSAGIEPKKGYGDLVFRTNLLESYREGAWQEYQNPALQGLFEIWQYIGVVDNRQREKHRHLSINPVSGISGGLFFPRDLSFFDVRGKDAANACRCRCDFIPIYARDWDRLQARGCRLSTMDDVRRAAA